MEQLETFKGYVVPEKRSQTQHDYCSMTACSGFCGNGKEVRVCLFDSSRPETLEPFNEWLETRKK